MSNGLPSTDSRSSGLSRRAIRRIQNKRAATSSRAVGNQWGRTARGLHDTHELNGRSHAIAVDQIAGIPVNHSVLYDADCDAAALSRLSREPTMTMGNYTSPYSFSLVDGKSRSPRPDVTRTDTERAVGKLLSGTDPETAHHA